VVGQLVPDVLADTSEDKLSRLLHLAESFAPLLKSAMAYSLPPALAESKARSTAPPPPPNFDFALTLSTLVAALTFVFVLSLPSPPTSGLEFLQDPPLARGRGSPVDPAAGGTT
jgi:hypothetical protein